MSDLQTNLATTLEVSPDQIMTFTPHDEGYTVILTDFRKFTAVKPTEPEPEPDPDAGYYPAALPAELRPVYDMPETYTVSYLRDLAFFLEIDRAGTLRKAELLEEIQAWKEANDSP
jgi:hypothetical protein